MSNFNNDTYEALVKDLLNDASYLEGRSTRGKIATLRQYSEVIVRRILDFSNEEFVTLLHNVQLKIKPKNSEPTYIKRLLIETIGGALLLDC